MIFRPYPILTLVAIPALALLISFGVWQLQRAEWKAGLISDYERALTAQPLSLKDALCGTPFAPDQSGSQPAVAVIDGESVRDQLFGARDFGADSLTAGEVIRMYGQDEIGRPGWTGLLAMPAPCSADIEPILVETYFEEFRPGETGVRIPAEDPGAAMRYLRVSWPEKPAFAIANTPAANDWHWFDAPAMAQALGIPRIEDRFYLAIMPDGVPAHLARTPPATHYGYAITWFGMAIAFVVIYALFHARAGRLRFRKQA